VFTVLREVNHSSVSQKFFVALDNVGLDLVSLGVEPSQCTCKINRANDRCDRENNVKVATPPKYKQ
jgi:hypothetical protein